MIRLAAYATSVYKSDVAAHCGEYCEVRTARATYYGRLLRLSGELFELEVHDRRGSAVAVFQSDEIQSILDVPDPHF